MTKAKTRLQTRVHSHNPYNLFVLGFAFFLCLVVISVWFSDGLLIRGHDFDFCVDPEVCAISKTSAWDPIVMKESATSLARAGYITIFKALHTAGVSTMNIQKLIFFYFLYISIVCSYFLTNHLLTRVYPDTQPTIAFVSFVSALIYTFNPHTLTYKWGSGYQMSLFAYSIYPALVLFFIIGASQKSFLGRIKYAFYIGVCTLLMSPAATTPTYLIVGLMIAVTFTLLWNAALMRFTDKE